ncbi:uncharacterized protein BJX67DRAFT_368559 [Aspergillus lucknowensis]|uniref:Retrovirus-related Pol polyprotein from transposon TNT 1-94-like beta-barrel domain-containing protein n=1 Tax=Aspergillus lucknowensis TaxID=176173 RepID=A0ABR4L5Q4_9EURO
MGEIGEFWKDMREYRKRRKRETPPRRRCWDWIIVSGNCHYAKNRSSFKEYRRVGRMVQDATGTETYIAGVGTVELNVRTSPKKGSPSRSLVLENVLHVPDAVCNGFSVGVYYATHGGTTSFSPFFRGTDEQGSALWHGKPFRGVEKLVLAGNPQGESYLESGPKIMSKYWSEAKLKEILSTGR